MRRLLTDRMGTKAQKAATLQTEAIAIKITRVVATERGTRSMGD
jgi:hypothetical protein